MWEHITFYPTSAVVETSRGGGSNTLSNRSVIFAWKNPFWKRRWPRKPWDLDAGQKACQGSSLAAQWLGPHAPNPGGLSWTPGQGTVSHTLQLGVCMPQLKEILHASTKVQCRQIKKQLLKKKRSLVQKLIYVFIQQAVWEMSQSLLSDGKMQKPKKNSSKNLKWGIMMAY